MFSSGVVQLIRMPFKGKEKNAQRIYSQSYLAFAQYSSTKNRLGIADLKKKRVSLKHHFPTLL